MATALNSAQIPRNPHNDRPCVNTGSATINANDVVQLDTANPITVSGQTGTPVKQAVSGGYPMGVALETAVQGAQLRVQDYGWIEVVASGAINMGDVVVPDAAGQVKTTGGGAAQLGQALSAAGAIGDTLLVQIQIAKNA